MQVIRGATHYYAGQPDKLAEALAIAKALPGIWIGARLAQHAPQRLVRTLLSLLLAYAGSKLVMA